MKNRQTPANPENQPLTADLTRQRIESLCDEYQQTLSGSADVVARGLFYLKKSLSDIEIHATDMIAENDFCAEFIKPPSFSLMVCLSGTLEVWQDGQQHTFEADASHPLLIVQRNRNPVNILRKNRSGERLTKVSLSLNESVIAKWIDNGLPIDTLWPGDAFSPVSTRIEEADSVVAAASRSIVALAGSVSFEDRLTIEQLSFRIIEHLVRKASNPARSVVQTRANRIQAYIDGALTEQIGLETIAERTGMSVSNLQRTFKEAFGITAIGYLRRQRLILALHMLRDEGRSISEVASSLHYGSNSNFSTAFKREWGQSPVEVLNRRAKRQLS